MHKSPFICHIGGSATTKHGTIYYENLYLYHLNKRSWHVQKTSGEIPINRAFHAIAVCADMHRVYLFGGRKSWLGEHNLYYLDLKTFIWYKVQTKKNNSKISVHRQSIPTSRDCHAMVYVNNCLYLYGGSNLWNEALGDFWVFDIAKNTWEQIHTQGSCPSARFGHVMYAIDNYIYILGGMDKNSMHTCDIWMFNIKKNEWICINDIMKTSHGEAILSNDKGENSIELKSNQHSGKQLAEVLQLLPGKFSVSCKIGHKILISGEGYLNSNNPSSPLLLFDVDDCKLALLKWNVKLERYSMIFVGTELYLTGGRFIGNNNYHYMSTVSLQWNFRHPENSLKILADIMIYGNEYDRTRAISVLTELVAKQQGTESIIDTSPVIQKAIAQIFQKANQLDIQAVLHILSNYFEIDDTRYLHEEIAYEVLEQLIKKLRLLVDYKIEKLLHSASAIIELSTIRQFIKIFNYIAIKYEQYDNYILLNKITSVLILVFNIPHPYAYEKEFYKDLEFYISFYQIICHIQSTAALTFHDLIASRKFSQECDLGTIESFIHIYITNTEYITDTDNVSHSNAKIFIEGIKMTREMVLSDLNRLISFKGKESKEKL
jgi:hypothetical protein